MSKRIVPPFIMLAATLVGACCTHDDTAAGGGGDGGAASTPQGGGGTATTDSAPCSTTSSSTDDEVHVCDLPDGPPEPPAIDNYCAFAAHDGLACCRKTDESEIGVCRGHECHACAEEAAPYGPLPFCVDPTCCAESVAELDLACALGVEGGLYTVAMVCSEEPVMSEPTTGSDHILPLGQDVSCVLDGVAVTVAVWCRAVAAP